MRSTTILWHPTHKRVLDVSNQTKGGEILLVLPSPLNLEAIDNLGSFSNSIILVIQSGELMSGGYALLRRLQRNKWNLALCYPTDKLASGEHFSLSKAIEVAQKFRIDVDFLLTLPSDSLQAADAVRIFRFLTTHAIRRVSFAYSLLLGNLGIKTANPTKGSEFFDAFYEAWSSSERSLVFDDLHFISSKLIAAQECGPEPLAVTFVDSEFDYFNVDGPVPELRGDRRAEPRRNEKCLIACDYYRVCGGDMYGAKMHFNGTLTSSDNPYCTLVAKPLFSRALETGCQ